MGNPYVDSVSASFHGGDIRRAGTSAVSICELATLRGMHRQVIEANGSVRSDNDWDRIKHQLLSKIIREGYPMPTEVLPRDVGEAGLYHLCCVAETLAAERGPDGARSTYWSYVNKSHFDRFAHMCFIRAGRYSKDSPHREGNIYLEWETPTERTPGFENSDVQYPEGLENSKIYGVGKVNRLFPAVLMRNLEEIRLGLLSEKQMERYEIGIKTDLEKFAIPWNTLERVIVSAEDIDDYAASLAVCVMGIFVNKRDMTNKQIMFIILEGYDPRGPIKQHGNIPEISRLWSRIIDKCSESQNTRVKEMTDPLTILFLDRMKEVSAEFDYISEV